MIKTVALIGFSEKETTMSQVGDDINSMKFY